MTGDSDKAGILERFRGYYTLLDPTLRWTVLIALPFVTAVLFITTGLGVIPDKGWGQAFGFASVLFLLGVIVEHVTDYISRGDERAVQVFAKETEEAARIRQHQLISKKKPKNVKLCEYSSYTAVQYLDSLKSLGTTDSVKLLICDPREVSDDQRNRIRSALYELTTHITQKDAQRMGLEIKCYSPKRAALRGRNYDDQFVVLGWYTVHLKPEEEWPEPRLYGANNAVLIALCDNSYGEMLRVFFDEVFDSLWRDAVPLQEALSAAGEADSSRSLGWLAKALREDEGSL